MPTVSMSAGKKRLAILVGLSGVIAVGAFLLSGPGIELISEDTMTASVVEILQRDQKEPSNSVKPLAIAVVELADGGRARVFAPRGKISMGAEIRVKVKRYSDGNRHVIGIFNSN